MFVLAMVMLILPALFTHDSFKTIKAIDKKFEYVREYVTAILMGDDPVLDMLAYENNGNNFAERSTEPRALYYTGKEIMHVESNLRYNVYLRGWIGTTYNDETGSWQTPDPDSETLAEYRSLFGSSGRYVVDPSETMMYSFYTLSDPTAIPTPAERDYTKTSASHTSDGYVVAQVNMKRTDLNSKLLYMPSFYIRDFNIMTLTKAGKYTYFMREYGGTEAGKITYANFFDGIYTSYRASKRNDGYAAVAIGRSLFFLSHFQSSVIRTDGPAGVTPGDRCPCSGKTEKTSSRQECLLIFYHISHCSARKICVKSSDLTQRTGKKRFFSAASGKHRQFTRASHKILLIFSGL